MFSVEPIPWIREPRPDSAVEAVIVPLLVRVIPVATVRRVLDVIVPPFVKALFTVSVGAVIVPLFVKVPPAAVKAVPVVMVPVAPFVNVLLAVSAVNEVNAPLFV